MWCCTVAAAVDVAKPRMSAPGRTISSMSNSSGLVASDLTDRERKFIVPATQ